MAMLLSLVPTQMGIQKLRHSGAGFAGTLDTAVA